MKEVLSGKPFRKGMKRVVALAVLTLLVAAFCGADVCAAAAKIQFVPAIIAGNFVVIALLSVLVVLKGRIYCEIICPLGIIQDLLRMIARKKIRRVCSRYRESRLQTIVKWTVFLLFVTLGFTGCSFMWLDPYGIFGRGMMLSGVLFFLVAALSFAGKGRLWCNWICPVGTILQYVSRFSVFRDRFDKCDHCEECRKCVGK